MDVHKIIKFTIGAPDSRHRPPNRRLRLQIIRNNRKGDPDHRGEGLTVNDDRMKRDYFGFLPNKWTIEFDGGKISPIPEFDKAAAWIDEYTNEDGFLYPPIVQRVEVDPVAMKPLQYIPKTERPAHLHKIPSSHELCISASGLPEDIRKGPESFILHLLAYLFGVRLQFDNWWLDGRLPIREKARSHNIRFNENTVKDFLSHCYKMWKSWHKKNQKLITNVLFMHSRVPSYEWDWERFTTEYIVLDGCYRLAEGMHLVKKEPSHGKRIGTLCEAFDIPINEGFISEIVRLRNDLFHETLWDRSQPCTAASTSAFILTDHIRRLNQRLIPALLGYKTPYIQTGWWFLGTYSFDQPSLSQGVS